MIHRAWKITSHVFSLLLLTTLVSFPLEGWITRPESKQDKPGEQIGVQIIPRDQFPVFNNPVCVDPETAEEKEYIRNRDYVIGLVINGEAKAYPIGTMGIHELGNDTVGGLPVAVTW